MHSLDVFSVSWVLVSCAVLFALRKGEKKDTVRNIESTRDFMVNIMDETYIKPTIQTSVNYPSDVDEIKKVGLTAVASDRVKFPRVAEAQISIECQLVRSLEFGKGLDLRNLIFGEVILVHVKDNLWADGRIQASKAGFIGRIGGKVYCRTTDIFDIPEPKL